MSKKQINLWYIFALLAIFFERIVYLVKFAFIYTDSDQSIFWLVSRDILRGEFHGITFYGQSYNPIIEPILSLPLLLIGIGYSVALPIASSLLTIAPFLLISHYIYKHHDKIIGLLPLFIVLLLSSEYGMLTSIPRGFVSGIFFIILALYLFLRSSSKIMLVLAGLFAGFSIFANPNAVLLLPLFIPAYLYIKSSKKNHLILFVIGFAVGISTILFNAYYFHIHPELIIHHSPSISLSSETFLKVISSLDNYFDFVSPVLWKAGWLSLTIFIFATVYLYHKKRKSAAVFSFLLVFMLIFTFFIKKTGDATNSIFFSGARMYLAYPFLILFVVFSMSFSMKHSAKIHLIKVLGWLAFMAVIIKTTTFNYFLNHALRGSADAVVSVAKVHEIEQKCIELIEFNKSQSPIVIANSPINNSMLLIYACPCLMENFMQTLYPQYERRTWLMRETNSKVYKNILLIGSDSTLINKLMFHQVPIVKANTDSTWLIIENNWSTKEFLEKMNFLYQ